MKAAGMPDSGFLAEEHFVARLHLEQRRTERSRRPFIFMLLESRLLKPGQKHGVCEEIVRAVLGSIRVTDVPGWYQNESAIGLIFTEISSMDVRAVGDSLMLKIRNLLADRLSASQMNQIQFSVYVFPQDWDKQSDKTSAVLYPDSVRARRASQVCKRWLDIAGSLFALLVGLPLFLAIAVIVKLTSKGPILFRQDRVGQFGQKFTFLKFRSMYVNNDHEIHREYVQNLIAGGIGEISAEQTNGAAQVFKLTDDPRVTLVGKFLRKTSLDEIPQFLNVLAGEMSLVGPRPPIPYEVEAYDIWHRRRLLAVKPGITGLWQVHGRSRTTFDEMVRLDLQYARSWSVWMDLKILLRTPRAVVAGDGAY